MTNLFDTTELNAGFVRQRRSLIIASISLLASETVGIKIDKINVFGNELILENPRLLPIALWVIFIYILLRYFQYFYDTKDRGIKKAYESYKYKIINNYIYKMAQSDYKIKSEYPPESEFTFFGY